MPTPSGCKGCGATVRLSPGEVERLVADYLASHPTARLAADEAVAHRLAQCAVCDDLQHGTTCRHCGCLVAVRARLADHACPAPLPRWDSEGRRG